MERVRRTARIYACVLMCGCGVDALPGEVPCDVFAGDVVITEIHANPDGSDGTNEFIELYNARDETIELAGLTLIASREDGTGASRHRFGAAAIPPSSYFVLGNTAPEVTPAHVDYGYGTTLGNLRNSDARLSLWCNDDLIDEVRYARTDDGRSLELDGRVTPDASVNDDEARWCVAPDEALEVFLGNFGTPGSANHECSSLPSTTPCTDGAGAFVPPPVTGDVHIDEWLANPVGADGALEWVEVRFDERCDLGGVRLGPAPDELGVSPFESCSPVDAGARIVFGASPAAAPRVDAGLGFSLGNTGARSIVVAIGDEVLDRIDYTDPSEGQAQQVDEAGDVCTVAASPDQEYMADNFGTPGAPNPLCPAVIGPGMCLEQGVPRAIRKPSPPDVRIAEWMANPSQADNRHGEWVEVEFARSVDLNGLRWSDLSATSDPIENTSCLPVAAGSRVVFARSADPELNGGLPVVDEALGVTLNNTNESISLSVDDGVLDTITYISSQAGVANQLDATGFLCEAVSPYGEGDLGTPGGPNRACP